MVTESVLAAPKAGEVTLKLGDPLVIYSRFDLNNMLLERAERAGRADREDARDRASSGRARAGGCRPAAGSMDADFCIVATGARNPLRDVGTQLTAPDTMSALGYYVQGDQEKIDIQFLPDLEGYIWIFPRCGHLSVGICGKGEPASLLRKRLEAYMAGRGLSWKGAAFYSHLLPSLDTKSWKQQPRGGRWMDGGGRCGRPGGSDHRRRPLLCDAVGRPGGAERADRCRRSRRRASNAIARCCGGISRRIWNSGRGWRSGFFWDAFCSAACRSAWWNSRAGRPRFASVMQDLFAGKQPYLGLKKRLMRNLNGSLYEIAMSFGFGRIVPKAGLEES